MIRDYDTGVSTDVKFFVGTEVEHSPAYGLKTLFVVGLQSTDEIKKLANQNSCEHIYFGANMSFNPTSDEEWYQWEEMVCELMRVGFLATLDVKLEHVDKLTETKMSELTQFIPMISVKIPHIKLLNLNTTVKIDDIGFNETNPGVWCHQLSKLTDKKVFTDWSKYTTDTILQ